MASALNPERDFIENSDYLKDLISRINKTKVSIEDKDFLQEIILADYYVNKLIRKSSKDSLFDVGTLKEMSAIFQGVLDTVDSKDILALSDTLDIEPVKDVSFKNYFIKSIMGFSLFVLLCFFIYYAVPFLVNTIFDSVVDFFKFFESTLIYL